MLSLNKYRLRHMVNQEHRAAIKASSLLAKPDKLIGVILIGNNLVNILLTMVATVIAERFLSEALVIALLPIILTFIILIFAEVTPKSIAALYPEKIAFPASFALHFLLIVLFPFVFLVNMISKGLAKVLGIDLNNSNLSDNLHPEELRTVVNEAGELIPDQHQGMLLNVLDLAKATVEDIMVPRNDVVGIDMTHDIKDIMQFIRTTEYTRLPVFEGDINNVIGILHLRNAARFIHGSDDTITHESIRDNLSTPYFVPESTSLPTQLLNFQKEKRRTAIAVNEYGEVVGIATLVDLLEEIVGDFSTDIADDKEEENIVPLNNKWYKIDGSTSIRDVNKHLDWDLPIDGPKTINGIVLEHLENIPDAIVSFEIAGYRFELTDISDTRIEKVKVTMH